MTRYVVRLVGIGVLIAGTPAVMLWLGYSGTAAALGALLAAALTWAPTLLALEGIHRARRLRYLEPGLRAEKHLPTRTDEP